MLAALALPGRAPALDAAEARHLLARSGFGGTPAEIEALAPLTREEAVTAILARAGDTAVTPPWPAANASAAANRRRPRSSSTGSRAS